MRKRNFPRHKFNFSPSVRSAMQSELRMKIIIYFDRRKKASKSVETFTHDLCELCTPHPVWPCGGSLTIEQVHISSTQFIVHTHDWMPQQMRMCDTLNWSANRSSCFLFFSVSTPCDMSATAWMGFRSRHGRCSRWHGGISVASPTVK